MEENKYDSWHASHIDENDISTPWHNFVKSAINLENIGNKEVLEIGCGRGGFSNYLLQQYPQIKKLYGCDYSDSALEICKKRLGTTTNLHFQKEDIQKLTFSDNSFDMIISCETIEHVTNPRKAISELFRVLRPSGRLILTCPNYFNFFGIWCIYRWLIGKPFTEGGQPYVNYIVMPLVYHWIKNAGFKIGKFVSAELIIPGRYPKQYYNTALPKILRPFGFRTFYVLRK